MRDRIEAAIEKDGIRPLARRLEIATNTLYRIYKGDSVNNLTILHVEANL